jgi:hypothetical protein
MYVENPCALGLLQLQLDVVEVYVPVAFGRRRRNGSPLKRLCPYLDVVCPREVSEWNQRLEAQ